MSSLAILNHFSRYSKHASFVIAGSTSLSSPMLFHILDSYLICFEEVEPDCRLSFDYVCSAAQYLSWRNE